MWHHLHGSGHEIITVKIVLSYFVVWSTCSVAIKWSPPILFDIISRQAEEEWCLDCVMLYIGKFHY